jgi:small subunit ribosomal protein S16|tara:strand:- start:190 stop:495 length:306 start_codon:yes stop_codon:yes gene_type:complete
MEKRIQIKGNDVLRIRLKRTGSKHQASYRIVVADQRKPRDGAFVDQLGHYNPRVDPPEIVIDSDKAREWMRLGAQPSDAVRRMIEMTVPIENIPSGDDNGE